MSACGRRRRCRSAEDVGVQRDTRIDGDALSVEAEHVAGLNGEAGATGNVATSETVGSASGGTVSCTAVVDDRVLARSSGGPKHVGVEQAACRRRGTAGSVRLVPGLEALRGCRRAAPRSEGPRTPGRGLPAGWRSRWHWRVRSADCRPGRASVFPGRSRRSRWRAPAGCSPSSDTARSSAESSTRQSRWPAPRRRRRPPSMSAERTPQSSG